MKLVVGYSISSNSMVADGFHFSDCSSNIVGLIGTALAANLPMSAILMVTKNSKLLLPW